MTIEKFQSLHEYEQEEIVFVKGVFLANYVIGDSICDVYQVYSFYVKFCYTLSFNSQAKVIVFDDPNELPFLHDINISGL